MRVAPLHQLPRPQIGSLDCRAPPHPGTIKVKQGDHVRLVITALDHDHGFKLEAFNIDQLLKKGEAVSVEFTADKAGTFRFERPHYCGLGHKRTKGGLIVE